MTAKEKLAKEKAASTTEMVFEEPRPVTIFLANESMRITADLISYNSNGVLYYEADGDNLRRFMPYHNILFIEQRIVLEEPEEDDND